MVKIKKNYQKMFWLFHRRQLNVKKKLFKILNRAKVDSFIKFSRYTRIACYTEWAPLFHNHILYSKLFGIFESLFVKDKTHFQILI